MLNPSTADAEVDDPTVRRVIDFGLRSPAYGVVVVNVYAFRATQPADLWRTADPAGPGNWNWLLSTAEIASAAGLPVVCAWGAHGDTPHVAKMTDLLRSTGAYLVCFGRTANGQPRHPLMLHADTPFERF
jgi:hypothetical protein